MGLYYTLLRLIPLSQYAAAGPEATISRDTTMGIVEFSPVRR